jgi:hypothetical protein
MHHVQTSAVWRRNESSMVEHETTMASPGSRSQMDDVALWNACHWSRGIRRKPGSASPWADPLGRRGTLPARCTVPQPQCDSPTLEHLDPPARYRPYSSRPPKRVPRECSLLVDEVPMLTLPAVPFPRKRTDGYMPKDDVACVHGVDFGLQRCGPVHLAAGRRFIARECRASASTEGGLCVARSIAIRVKRLKGLVGLSRLRLPVVASQ